MGMHTFGLAKLAFVLDDCLNSTLIQSHDIVILAFNFSRTKPLNIDSNPTKLQQCSPWCHCGSGCPGGVCGGSMCAYHCLPLLQNQALQETEYREVHIQFETSSVLTIILIVQVTAVCFI